MPDMNIGAVKPVFSDVIMSAARFMTRKLGKKSIEKEVVFEFVFADTVSKQAVSAVVIPLGVAENFVKNLEDTLKNAEKELESKEVPKQQTEFKQVKGTDYLG